MRRGRYRSSFVGECPSTGNLSVIWFGNILEAKRCVPPAPALSIWFKLFIHFVMDFATIIRDARTSSGLTLAALAGRAGVSPNAVWELESRGSGTVAVLSKLIRALDLRFAGLPKGNTLSEQVRTLRERRGWSQQRLAHASGVSTPAIVRLENGNTRIHTLSTALAILAPNVRVRKPDISNWGRGSRDERFTPTDLLARIKAVIGPIGLDPCGHPDSAVVAETVYYAEDDGLAQEWRAPTVYVNPPYSATAAFVAKAHASWRSGNCQTILMLLPVQTHIELSLGAEMYSFSTARSPTIVLDCPGRSPRSGTS